MTIRPIFTVLVYALTAAMSTISAQDSENDALNPIQMQYDRKPKS